MDDPAPIRVRLRSRPPATTVWLEVDYEGTEPPLDLFADLAMVGWHPPAPASPPASAIDWSAEDLAPGERFRILPWRVTGALVEPPHGSARRGGWAPGEREAFLLPLAGVLRRHGLADQLPGLPGSHGATGTGASPAGRPPTLPPPPAPPTPDAATPTAGPWTTASPADAAGTDAEPHDRTPGPRVVTAVVAPASRHAEVAEAVAPLGLPVHFAEHVRTVTSTYRGSTFETPTTVLEVQVLVEVAQADRVVDALVGCGLSPVVGPPAPAPDVPARDGGNGWELPPRDDLRSTR